jgi:hypothetical protein
MSISGQHAGIDPITNVECKGCGKQESFINCADIAITDEYGMFPSVNTAPPLQMTTAFPMYDTSSFMFEGQGMFPDYFDEYNPFFSTPSYFDPFDNPYMNDRANFRQQPFRNDFVSGQFNRAPQNTGFRANVQRNIGYSTNGVRGYIEQNTGLNRNGVRGNIQGNIGINSNGVRGNIQGNIGRNSNGVRGNIRRNTGINGNGVRGNMQRNTGINRNGVPGSMQRNTGINRNGVPGSMQRKNVGMNRNGARGNLEQNPTRNRNNNSFRNTRPSFIKGKRPFISRNNRPDVNMNVEIGPKINRNRNPINPINARRNNGPLMIMNRDKGPLNDGINTKTFSKPDDSEPNDFMEDLIDDEDLFLKNYEFWEDFNNLLNMSSPEMKHALYEIAEDADNLQEFHQNIKLMLQMQGNSHDSLPSMTSDSESDESLDMAWLMAEAEDIELDSDEKDLLGLAKGDGTSDENGPTQNKNTGSRYNNEKNDPYYHFHDENRIRDDTESGESYSDGFGGSSKDDYLSNDIGSPYDDDDSGPASDDLSKDYDNGDDIADTEVNIDNHISNIPRKNPNYQDTGESKYWNNENKKSYYFRNQIIPWNENSLYKTDVLDYDDKDVDIEGDNSNRYVKSMSENHITQDYQTEQTDIAKPDEITVNYLESDTQDYTDSETVDEGDDFDDVDKNWGDFTEEKNEMDNDHWSDEQRHEIEAENDIVTADSNNLGSGETETNLEKENTEDKSDTVLGHVKTNSLKSRTMDTEVDNKEENTIEEVAHDDEITETEYTKDVGETTGDIVDDPADLNSKDKNVEPVVEELSVDDIPILREEDIPEDQTKHTENNLRSETLHKIDDMKETMKTVMSGIQHPMSVDDPNESKKGISKISIFDDGPTIESSVDDFKSNPGVGRWPERGIFIPTNDVFNIHNRHTTIFPPFTSFQQKPPLTEAHNIGYKQLTNPSLSSFRKKIKDRISKSMSDKDPNSNLDSISNMLKSSDGKDTKKELSPNLSKLVLKMFMNAKSTKSSCSGSQQPICSPVSLWNKYRQVADWCSSLCPYGNCPSAVCTCTCETFSKGSGQKLCRAQNAFKKKSGELDVWCEKTCSAGDCPDLLCVCTSPRS